MSVQEKEFQKVTLEDLPEDILSAIPEGYNLIDGIVDKLGLEAIFRKKDGDKLHILFLSSTADGIWTVQHSQSSATQEKQDWSGLDAKEARKIIKKLSDEGVEPIEKGTSDGIVKMVRDFRISQLSTADILMINHENQKAMEEADRY